MIVFVEKKNDFDLEVGREYHLGAKFADEFVDAGFGRFVVPWPEEKKTATDPAAENRETRTGPKKARKNKRSNKG